MRFVKPRPWRLVSAITSLILFFVGFNGWGLCASIGLVTVWPLIATFVASSIPVVVLYRWFNFRPIGLKAYRAKRRIETKLAAFLRKDCTLFVNKQTGCAYRLYALRMGKRERVFMPFLICYSLEDEVRVDLHHRTEAVQSTEYYFRGRLDPVMQRSNFNDTPPMADSPRAWGSHGPSKVGSPLRELDVAQLEQLYQELCAAQLAD